MNPDPTSLDRLHDVIAPPPVPWWPPPPGWLWLGAFVLAIFMAWCVRAFIRHQANRYRREALAAIAKHDADLTNLEHRAAAIAGMAEVLKRAALTAWPRREVASLQGTAWSDFLNRTSGGKLISPRAISLMEAVAADPGKAATLDDAALRSLTDAARQWLIFHRMEEPETEPPHTGREAAC
jgi:hypothetical protein